MNVNLRTLLRLRMERRHWQFRGFRSRHGLRPVSNRTGSIRPDDVLCFVTLRNERIRLPYFFEHYRKIGIRHFVVVDNASTDGSLDYLVAQNDVSVWSTSASYLESNFGVDWMNHLLRHYGSGHWTLTVDPDEFFIYPFHDSRPIDALTDWLDTYGIRSFPAMLLDMYPKGPYDAADYREGQDPFEIACWFDSGNYMIRKNDKMRNLWIQGGPRARQFFAHTPEAAPSLNKTPLVRWSKSQVFTSSTHMLLPRRLNIVYDAWGGERASGCLLHAKFLSPLTEKIAEERERRQHYSGSREYEAYSGATSVDLWTEWSEKLINWRQLEILGLMSRGMWT